MCAQYLTEPEWSLLFLLKLPLGMIRIDFLRKHRGQITSLTPPFSVSSIGYLLKSVIVIIIILRHEMLHTRVRSCKVLVQCQWLYQSSTLDRFVQKDCHTQKLILKTNYEGIQVDAFLREVCKTHQTHEVQIHTFSDLLSKNSRHSYPATWAREGWRGEEWSNGGRGEGGARGGERYIY